MLTLPNSHMDMRKGKALLGFSGGIDSSRAAEILREEGYQVTALYMDMYGDRAQAEKAEEKANALGLDFRCIDLRSRFRTRVTDYFIAEYLRGRTPAPCTVCNREIKWAVLRETAIAEGYDRIATGHYFNIERRGAKYYVCAASDPVKDQSYYLWDLDQHMLSMALTPMGDQIKQDIKRSLGSDSAARESMGICFLSGRNYAGFIRDECGDKIPRGEIIDAEGRSIGLHDGIPYYTIGQKRGLGLPPGMCVIALDTHANRLIAGYDRDLYHRNLIISGCNIVDMEEVLTAADITVKIRGIGRNPHGFCKISPHDKGLLISLSDPAWASASGQPVVLYRENRVVGGGFLEEYF